MTALRIEVDGLPAPQGSKAAFTRGGRAVMIEQVKRVLPWRAEIAAVARVAMQDCGWSTHLGPVEVTATFTFPRPASHYGTGRNAAVLKASAPTFPLTGGDVEKLVRAAHDAFTAAGVWRDDKQVVNLHCFKRFGIPHATFIVEPLGPAGDRHPVTLLRPGT